ncbi:MAG: ribonuclease Z [Chitinophagales bacterium]|nr:ribonuclease Z [Chitinophagaceae bacterium]MCB9064170.1 ribonuclease Z [Chitinophagales bacterium]
MKVTILGNNSALPAFGRNPTSQIVSVYGEYLLMDCGEATQIQMQRHGIRWRKLEHIFISHMHGDHYFGLVGLINSMSLLGRVAPLHVYGPAPLQGIIQTTLDLADTELSYPFFFYPLPEGSDVLVETDTFKVTCFPTEHRIPCHGFLVESKTRGRKILPAQCRDKEIPRYFYDKLKKGEDYVRKDGKVVKNEEVTTEGPRPKKYAFCADTLSTDSFIEYIRGADTIYHESTYLHAEVEKATVRYHSTSVQAAELAKKAGVTQLLLGHYSSKYRDVVPFRQEARAIFPNTQTTVEGMTYDV